MEKFYSLKALLKWLVGGDASPSSPPGSAPAYHLKSLRVPQVGSPCVRGYLFEISIVVELCLAYGRTQSLFKLMLVKIRSYVYQSKYSTFILKWC